MCGEQRRTKQTVSYYRGSPPRVRGAVKTVDFIDFLGRITPACAGSRKPLIYMAFPCQDHPRVCGEQRQICTDCQPCPGSPPRVRGADYAPPGASLRLRITPACAGSRNNVRQYYSLGKDHPRVCGEQQG